MPKNIMIIGANFVNKGAQSMLFTTVDAIRREYPDSRIIFAHGDKCDLNSYNMDEVFFSWDAVKMALGENIDNVIWKLKIKNFIKKLIGREIQYTSRDLEELKSMIGNVDFIVDISGFAMGSKWGAESVEEYTDNIKLAKKYDVPMILMPQSFGPFDFGEEQEKMDKLIREYMSYPIHVFARENDGALPLREKYGLNNVSQHVDLVLCSDSPVKENIYSKAVKTNIPKVAENSVGILPNMRGFDHGDRTKILAIFQKMVTVLLEKGKTVYLFRHSFEDLTACRWIKALFSDESRVVLWGNDFSCFEYDEVCRQFEFLIVGRFHGVVHAYRNNVPCIILGWAVKYHELSEVMGQMAYVFDITEPGVDPNKIIAAINDMDEHLQENKTIIKERLSRLRSKSNCFEVMLKGIRDAASKKMVQ